MRFNGNLSVRKLISCLALFCSILGGGILKSHKFTSLTVSTAKKYFCLVSTTINSELKYLSKGKETETLN